MAHVTFKGGVYPHKRKRFTREKTLEKYLPKGDLVYPLLQHIGGMAVPVVEPGERVLEGTADCEGQRGYFRAGTCVCLGNCAFHRAQTYGFRENDSFDCGGK